MDIILGLTALLIVALALTIMVVIESRRQNRAKAEKRRHYGAGAPVASGLVELFFLPFL